MKTGEFVLAQLTNPREKFWGILRDRDATGVTIRGLTLEAFEGWIREIAHKEQPTFFPATVFFPLHRVERISMDETLGEAVSLADRFRRQIGKDPRIFLAQEMPED
jgi:hypothetical protein